MSLYILHPQTVTTPSYLPSLIKARNVSTPILPRYCTARSLSTVERQPVRAIIPVENMQRSEKTTILQQPIEELLGLGARGEHPVRKRERLNHLTAEEKQNRRKLKNRVAAQTARDRKKYRANKLEEAVRMLILENGKLREENKCLKKTCEELKDQNIELQDLLNNNREHEKTCSETEVNSSMPSSSLGSAESIRGPQQREQAMMRPFDEMQKIIGEICAIDGTDPTLQDVDGTALEFERFCSKILSEIDNTTGMSDTAESKPPKNCKIRRMDCTTPDIIIAPEYLKSNGVLQTSISNCSATAINGAVEHTESSSRANFDLETNHGLKCEQSPDYSSFRALKSPDVSRGFSSSPSFIFFDDIKEENSGTSSPLITDNDPMFCVPHKWDIDDDYI
uniref:X-box-binding protein 1 n=1 Tax=Loa loa TaxID=7209 RepID=A0A1I7W313_LOALO